MQADPPDPYANIVRLFDAADKAAPPAEEGTAATGQPLNFSPGLPAQSASASGDDIPPDPPDGSDDGPGDGAEPPLDPDTLRLCAAEPVNDTGNGQRLLHWHRGLLLHVREVGWHGWTGTHWDREGGDEMAVIAAQVTAHRIAAERLVIAFTEHEQKAVAEAEPLKDMQDEALDESEKRVKAEARKAFDARARRRSARVKFAVQAGNSGKIAGMLAQALPHCSVAPDRLDQDPLAFNVANGTLRFRRVVDEDCPDPDVIRTMLEVTLEAHAPGDLISHLAPVTYDPQARCPKFLAAIERFQPVEPVRRFLQVYLGLSLTALVEQLVVFNWGKGANGKSTIIEAVAKVVGSYADVLSPESIMEVDRRRGDQATPDFARLPGKRFLRVAELKRGEPLNESMVKRLTGGETMPVRHLNKGFFDFEPVFKAVMSGNDKPEIKGGDNGIWRRVHIVDWPIVLTKGEQRPMSEILAEFEAERSGILNWLIDGLRLYFSEGLVVPAEVSQFTDQHRSDMDPLGGFIGDCLITDEGSREQARTVFIGYTSWCMANAVKPWSETAFGRAMSSKGYVKVPGRSEKDSAVKFYANVRLQNVPDRPESSRSDTFRSPAPPDNDSERRP